MDLIEEKIDELDLNRQKEYEEKMKRHISSGIIIKIILRIVSN